ncbi:E3 ubiquitin protein ligase RIN2-like [Punica granatum]|uniref:Uncharacterized protein n=2 Tax=Punica granatum TaxID=22663 RepID=A0A218X2N5_PUNGR|nr:E3 ubiquitin protein ligase RIN2-like [Punica granatum]OWM79455.1 hypothetical protein CDL15_Pgr022867 [Punica granatum]PKI65748.1 hypothetical protein CRG98_013820 [Punica granatum]
MGASYFTSLSVSGICTVISFVGLQWWTQWPFYDLIPAEVVTEYIAQSEKANHAIELISSSYTTLLLLANFALSAFGLLLLCLKTVFFVELSSSEIRKLLERLVNYVVYKGTFLPLIIPPTLFQAGIWTTWLTVLCSLKMFQALGRDRLERLNSSPSTAPGTYFRVYSVLFFVLAVDLFWIRLCLMIYRTVGAPLFLLLFFEPFSIVFETLQAIVVHGFQFLDIWFQHSLGDGSTSCRIFKYIDTSAAGSFCEWKGLLVRNLGFTLDMATLLMALGHYLHIWWLHGMAFQLMDAVLFLNIRALLSAMIKRIKGYIKLRMALGTLHAALPDATAEELRAYDDECAICREPMAKAKRLDCKHLFHLACLRSWLDQGLNDVFSCPTCRKPLFVAGVETASNPSREVPADEELARRLSLGIDGQNAPGLALPIGAIPGQMQNPFQGGLWRNAGWEPNLGNTWSAQGVDGPSPSTGNRPVGLNRVQMMMRNLAAMGSQTAVEDNSWGPWPFNPSEAAASGSTVPPPAAARARFPSGLHLRTASRDDDIAHLIAMAEAVREVLPHVPDELILQDLQQTNSATVTVNNLLQN